MHVFDWIQNQPWAMWPTCLETLLSRVPREANIPLEALAAKLGQPLAQTYTAELRDGVAMIPISSVVMRYANRLSQLLGATALDVFALDFQQAIENPEVKAIILNIDSPGGTVTGVNECADRIYAARGQKPIVAYVSGMAASAAYWLASSSDEIILDETASVGSIGVVSLYTDDSEQKAKNGIRQIQMVNSASPRKCLDVTSDAGKAEIQAFIDRIADVFFQKVARNRNVTTDRVLSQFGQGSLFVGSEAVSQGLADRLGSLEQVITELSKRTSSTSPRGFTMTQPPMILNESALSDHAPMATMQSIAEQYPAIAEQLRQEGAVRERDRIQAVENQLLLGHETLIQTLKFDGKTTGAEAAMQLLAAEKGLRSHQLAQLKADAPSPMAPMLGSDEGSVGDTQDGAMHEESYAEKWRTHPQLRAEFSHQAAYVAFMKARQNGQVKVISHTLDW